MKLTWGGQAGGEVTRAFICSRSAGPEDLRLYGTFERAPKNRISVPGVSNVGLTEIGVTGWSDVKPFPEARTPMPLIMPPWQVWIILHFAVCSDLG